MLYTNEQRNTFTGEEHTLGNPDDLVSEPDVGALFWLELLLLLLLLRKRKLEADPISSSTILQNHYKNFFFE